MKDRIKDTMHNPIAVYIKGLFLITGHTPEGKLLFNKYTFTMAYPPMITAATRDILLKIDTLSFMLLISRLVVQSLYCKYKQYQRLKVTIRVR
jgi:hypothetical protein